MNNSNHTDIDTQTDIQLESPPILTEDISAVFKKAAEFNLTAEEKNKTANALTHLLYTGNIPSPYTQPTISTTDFFHKKFGIVKEFIFVHRSKILHTALSIFLIFGFIAGTTYASVLALPGDLLYPIKVKIKEPLESALAISNTAKAKVATKHILERLKEVQQLSVAGDITKEDEETISANIIQNSKEIQETVVTLKAKGQPIAAKGIATYFENSVSLYKNDIKNSSTLSSSSRMNILKNIDEEVQKITVPEIIVPRTHKDSKNRIKSRTKSTSITAPIEKSSSSINFASTTSSINQNEATTSVAVINTIQSSTSTSIEIEVEGNIKIETETKTEEHTQSNAPVSASLSIPQNTVLPSVQVLIQN